MGPRAAPRRNRGALPAPWSGKSAVPCVFMCSFVLFFLASINMSICSVFSDELSLRYSIRIPSVLYDNLTQHLQPKNIDRFQFTVLISGVLVYLHHDGSNSVHRIRVADQHRVPIKRRREILRCLLDFGSTLASAKGWHIVRHTLFHQPKED